MHRDRCLTTAHALIGLLAGSLGLLASASSAADWPHAGAPERSNVSPQFPGGARLGGADPAFNPAVNGMVNLIAVQPDNRILIVGGFTEVGDTPRNGFARLNADGSLDESFQPQTFFPPTALAVGPDGGILVGNSLGRVFQRLRSDGASGPISLRILRRRTVHRIGPRSATFSRSGTGRFSWRDSSPKLTESPGPPSHG